MGDKNAPTTLPVTIFPTMKARHRLRLNFNKLSLPSSRSKQNKKPLAYNKITNNLNWV